MWQLWRKATTYHKLPSEIFGEDDPLAAWSLDNAVTAFGTLVENMLQERDEIGSGQHKQWVQRYTLERLLDDAFYYPRPLSDVEEIKAMDRVEGLKIDGV